ncbi:MAG: hypothetical protein JNK53_06160, partial [Phycisphaerae bacterium]|nr:hypothetical protein [Phycisphaerae bacterium]
MRFETAQHLKTSQNLKLAPRLIQSMEILALPAAALEERIVQELERNVALETEAPELDAEQQVPDRERALTDDDGSAQGFERLREMERSYGDLFDGDGGGSRSNRHDGERDAKMAAMANTPSPDETLVERLQHEWRLAEVPEELRAPGLAIIELLNDDGLLGAPLESALSDGCDLATLERALAALQANLEPPGLAARDVRESLLLQINAIISGRDADRGTGHALQSWLDARQLVEREWDDLLENRLPRIEARSGISMARINAAREAMRRLRLSPGRDVADRSPPPIVPDAVVEYDADQDRYVAALSEGGRPVLRVSQTYDRMAKDANLDRATRDFVGQNVRSAEWLIEAIHQRRSTLLRVVEQVVLRQRAWF